MNPTKIATLGSEAARTEVSGRGFDSLVSEPTGPSLGIIGRHSSNKDQVTDAACHKQGNATEGKADPMDYSSISCLTRAFRAAHFTTLAVMYSLQQ